ncbi:MAG: tryptophanase [Bacteroidales bacterium]|nr:tryptophanase [Bacteroidales bacterium]MBN2821374.1 tryptophanase [Bacteroidales bacterium]
MANIKFFLGEEIPLEMHKVRMVQRLDLVPIERRLAAIEEAGNNTFLLYNKDIYLDMLTDSGVNAMSDQQTASMLVVDDSYAGSATFTRLNDKINEIFGKKYFLPVHQGRACENLLSQYFVKKGTYVPMNYHFTTTKAHIMINGGEVLELLMPEAVKPTSSEPFKGNLNLDELQELIATAGAEKIAFIRIEAGTNLIGGQPVALDNFIEAGKIANKHKIPFIIDASLLADNLHFIKTREEKYKNHSIREITEILSKTADVIYFSARKLGHVRGGGIITNDETIYKNLLEMLPLYEGFSTYGGMSVREMEAMTIGLDETMDEEMINQGPIFIKFMVEELVKLGVPVITPPGGLGAHLNAMEFLSHIPQEQYRAGALGSALYIASGVRGMERGTISEEREADGSDHLAAIELLRLALPRRVFTLSQIKYTIDRIAWLYENRKLIGGLEFYEEPKVLRFFFGKLRPTSDWQQKLVAKFKADFGDSL